ncbi:UNVERIFIED_CONTAM: hypothetical protein Sradi_4922100 [Sesamum radiatum]|uniref:Uncharacterized protein n=1 Tax=Sesamum radiatum TaxID=300843 RepID=A0AAW2MCX3_SESRA
MGCPVCIDDTRAFHLQNGRKACYFDYHRQFLLAHYSYRRDKKAFIKNRIQNKVARPRLIVDQILDRVANISPAVEMPLLLPDGYGSNHKWAKKSIVWLRELKKKMKNKAHVEASIIEAYIVEEQPVYVTIL